MRGLWWVLLGAVILIQAPDDSTETLYIDEVTEDVYFVISEDNSETLYIMDMDKEDTGWEKDMK